jgi:hypothetical protein
MGSRWARPWFAATAGCAIAGVIISTFTAAHNHAGFFDTSTKRAFNTYAFFTVQSNLIVAGTTLLLAVRLNRRSLVFWTFRQIGVVCIAVTGIVYHVALARLLDLESWDLVGDQMVHTVVPILAIAGWLMYGPRGQIPVRVVWWSLSFPLAWLAFTIIRGAAVGFYPYPFIDVTKLGYAKTILNCVWVAVLLLGLSAAIARIEGRLGRAPDRPAQVESGPEEAASSL